MIFANAFPLAHVMKRFPDLHKAEEGLAGRCPCVHEGEIEGVILLDQREDGLWSIAGCDMGCGPRKVWDAASVGLRQSGEDEVSQTPPTRWGFTSATDFLARIFPPQRWLYLDLVPAESVAVIMAAPNAGKTFFGLDVICQVAARVAGDGKKVTLVEEEGTGAALQWRLSRALAAVGGADQSLINIAWNTGRNIRDHRDLQSLIKESDGSELIMLDSLSALAGGVNENDSEEMAQVAEALHQLKTGTGAAVVPLHHMTKAAWKDGETPRLEHMRGHGALPGRADTVIALVPLESDEQSVNFEVHCVKQRDGSKPKARRCSVAMKGLAALMTVEAKDEAPHTKNTAQVELDTYSRIPASAPGVSKTFLENVVKGHRAQEVRRAVDRMVDTRRVVQTPSGRYVRGAQMRSHETD